MATCKGPACVNRQHLNKGEIQIIFGPMFSGKTTELLRRIKRFQVAKYKCVVIKYEKDKRYDKMDVATHDRQTSPAISCMQLSAVKEQVKAYEVIGVDEGQFFPDTVQFCEEMAKLRKTVIVAALDGDFQRKPFGNIIDLVPIAEKVEKLNAVCMNCFEEGSFTKRISTDTQLEVIGGVDKYMAVCRTCHESCCDFLNDEKNTVGEEKKALDLRSEKKVLNSIENFPNKVIHRNKENIECVS